jgi:hypothetical protein
VRRMLMEMKSRTEALRALLYWTAAQMDHAQHNPDVALREKAQATVDFMIPVVKGWCTESSIEIASTGIQIHGGVGFIEETGASQYLRDARITTIYEGTTGIQGNDLIGRKLAKEKIGAGMTASALQQQIKACVDELSGDKHLAVIGRQLGVALADLDTATEWMLENYDHNPQAAHAGAVSYLLLTGIVTGGWQMARAAQIAQRQIDAGSGDDFHKAKLVTARYFAAHQLPKTMGYCAAITEGSESVLSLDESLF